MRCLFDFSRSTKNNGQVCGTLSSWNFKTLEGCFQFWGTGGTFAEWHTVYINKSYKTEYIIHILSSIVNENCAENQKN